MTAATPRRARSAIVAHIPNLLCLARLACVPVVVWAILERDFALALWIFIAAGISDALDGFIAKRFGAESVFGAYLDPIADKALLVGVYVSLVVREMLPLWLVILVVFRDLVIVGGALVIQAATQRLSMEPLPISKANTAAQISLAALVLAMAAFAVPGGVVVEVGTWVVAATTLLSGVAYVVTWIGKVSEWERER
jgi:cardiolipin synthase